MTREVDTSAMPTSDRLRAPTSLVPSPHIMVTAPHSRCVDKAICDDEGVVVLATGDAQSKVHVRGGMPTNCGISAPPFGLVTCVQALEGVE